MGLLDDAIREHLDLKRRRGADPAEVERLAQEALGPVRRRGDPEVAAEPEPAAEPAVAHEGGPETVAGDPVEGPSAVYATETPAHSTEETEYAPLDEPIDHDEPENLDDWHLEDDRTRVLPAADHEDVVPPPLHLTGSADDAEPVVPPVRMSDTTAEFNVEEALAAEHDDPVRQDEGEPPVDVGEAGVDGEDEVDLDETPEFLQDAPDHDRLWFEQRPPKDFDFGS